MKSVLETKSSRLSRYRRSFGVDLLLLESLSSRRPDAPPLPELLRCCFKFAVLTAACSSVLTVLLSAAVKESLSADVQTRREQISAEPRHKLRIFYQVSV